MNKGIFLFISFFLIKSSSESFAQTITSPAISLIWIDSTKQVELPDLKKHNTFYFSGAQYDLSRTGVIPLYTTSIKLPGNSYPDIKVINSIYENVGDIDFDEFPKDVKATYYTIGYEKGKPVADIYIPTVRKIFLMEILKD